MFELSQLRCFIVVATELNFSTAARRLNMTQPPLSRKIQLLEHQLGIALIERSTRSVRLTEAGKKFFIEAQSLLDHAYQIELSAKKISLGQTGTLTISFVSSAIYDLLPYLIQKITTLFPNIQLVLNEMNSFQQIEALRTQRIDIGIVRSLMGHHKLHETCIVQEPFVVAINAAHPLSQQTVIDLRCLEKQPFIMYSLSGWQPFYEIISGAFRMAQISPDITHHVSSTLLMLSLVNGNLGIAIVPKSAASIKFENVIYRDILSEYQLLSKLYLVWSDGNHNPALKTVIESIEEMFI